MILLFGFGGVGRTLAQQIYQRTRLKIVAVFDSSGGVYKRGGFTREEVEKLASLPRGFLSNAPVGEKVDIDHALDEAEIVVDVSPPNYETGEPAYTLYKKTLRKGKAVVTANKAPLALHFDELRDGVYYKATVMAGTPLVDLLKGLEPQRVESFMGILNGSTNYILTRVYKDGASFEAALEEARTKGILEPDPRLDLEGIDAAAKLVIVANTLGVSLKLGQVAREPLTPMGPVTKYIAYLDVDAQRGEVKPVRLDPVHPLANVDYTLNAAYIKTEVNDIYLVGKGAGRLETSLALLNDILSFYKTLRGK